MRKKYEFSYAAQHQRDEIHELRELVKIIPEEDPELMKEATRELLDLEQAYIDKTGHRA